MTRHAQRHPPPVVMVYHATSAAFLQTHNGDPTLEAVQLVLRPKTKIPDYAFCDCSVIASVVSPPNDKDNEAENETDLDSHTKPTAIPTAPTMGLSLGAFCLAQCRNLQSIDLRHNHHHMIQLDHGAFSQCPHLTQVSISNLQSLGQGVWESCPRLRTVSLEFGVTTAQAGVILPRHSFRDCFALERIQIQGHVKELGDGAFSNCHQLREFPSLVRDDHKNRSNGTPKSWTCHHLERIGDLCFANCWRLSTTLILPATLRSVGRSAFANCHTLPAVEFLHPIDAIPTIHSSKETFSLGISALEGCSSLQKVQLANLPLTTLDRYTFRGCTGLRELELPHSLTQLQCQALADCHSLGRVVLPLRLQQMGNGVLSNCHALASVEFRTSRFRKLVPRTVANGARVHVERTTHRRQGNTHLPKRKRLSPAALLLERDTLPTAAKLKWLSQLLHEVGKPTTRDLVHRIGMSEETNRLSCAYTFVKQELVGSLSCRHLTNRRPKRQHYENTNTTRRSKRQKQDQWDGKGS